MPTRRPPKTAGNSMGLAAFNVHTERNLPVDLKL